MENRFSMILQEIEETLYEMGIERTSEIPPATVVFMKDGTFYTYLELKKLANREKEC